MSELIVGRRDGRGRYSSGTRASVATEIKPGQRLSPRTEFQPGQPAHNRLPVGSLTIRMRFGSQRAFVKIAEPNVWRERAKVVWEAAHGMALPRGMVVHHKDRDPLNDDISNLAAMTRAEHAAEHADEARAAGFGDEEARRRACAARRRRHAL
jgi:hypothetical protein